MYNLFSLLWSEQAHIPWIWKFSQYIFPVDGLINLERGVVGETGHSLHADTMASIWAAGYQPKYVNK